MAGGGERSPRRSSRTRRSRCARTCASCAGSSTRCSASPSSTRRDAGSTSPKTSASRRRRSSRSANLPSRDDDAHGLRVRDLREEGPHRRRHRQSAGAHERAAPARQLRARRDLERLRARPRGVGRHPHGRRRQGVLGRQRPALHRRARARHDPHGGQRLRRPHQPHAVLEADHRRRQRLRARRRASRWRWPATSSSPPTTPGSACPSRASASWRARAASTACRA